jgi:DmsE family decaheme c-type cytochrome
MRLLPIAVASVALAWAAAAQDSKLKPGYAGSETCAGCHSEISEAFVKNRHHLVDTDKKRGWEGMACEGCHGPGAKHAETTETKDIIQPAKLGGLKSMQTCLGCHTGQPVQTAHLQNAHSRNGVACTSCHNVHKTGAESTAAIQRKPIGVTGQCASCHVNIMAQFRKPHAHRVPEGAMACNSCHNPHGSLNPRNLRTANGNDLACVNCHSDKRGPFVYEHLPVRNEPCTICHEQHGSANPRMLNRAQVFLQCLECHSNVPSPSAAGTLGGVPPAFHDLRNPRYKNCTSCHQKIHGSNVSKGLLR